MKGRENYYKVSQNPHLIPSQNQTEPLIGASRLNLAEYLSAIPDKTIRSLVSELARMKLKETHKVLDWYTKALWHLTHNCPNFIDNLSNHIQSATESIFKSFDNTFKKNSIGEINFFKNYLTSNNLMGNYKATYDKEIDFEAEFTAGKSITQTLDEIKDLADYKHHQIMKKLAIKRFSPAPVIQDMKKIVQIVNFDKLHKASVNCVDICPFGKILVSASNDGSIKFIDLETMKQINEIEIYDNNKKQIKSVCIDDKHNVAYVNEENILRIFNISVGRVIAEYKGEKMSEFIDIVPNQACQFTSDFNYLAFRSGGKKITMFDMYSKGIVKEYDSDELINDFTISPQRDYIATAIYSECMTDIISVSSGEKVSQFKVDSKKDFVVFIEISFLKFYLKNFFLIF